MKVAIVGRPNVGKSTLFNRMCARKIAIISDTSGLTRDRKECDVEMGSKQVTLIDTAGIDESPQSSTLEKEMMIQTQLAINSADLVLFVVDARSAINSLDKNIADMIRASSKDTLLVANKGESRIFVDADDLYSMGFGGPIFISSEHNIGLGDLATIILRFHKGDDIKTIDDDDGSKSIKISIVGRPNVGKSTLFNNILGDARVITSSVAGTTRDSIYHNIKWGENAIELIDTAGMRKKRKVQNEIEMLSNSQAITAIRSSHVVILLLDASQEIEKQDLTIANVALNEGRALLIVVNKCDKIKTHKKKYTEALYKQIESSIWAVRGVRTIFISALQNHCKDKVFKNAIAVFNKWNTKISTGRLNKWLSDATTIHTPPYKGNGLALRLKYITQTSQRPPTFKIFCNTKETDIKKSYQKYLYNSLRKNFGIEESSIRIKYTQSKNPYMSTAK